MNRFYRVRIDKRYFGTAVQHREPSLEGKVVARVAAAAVRGNFKLLVVDASDTEHNKNVAHPDVLEVLPEAAAVDLAAKLRPERMKRVTPLRLFQSAAEASTKGKGAGEEDAELVNLRGKMLESGRIPTERDVGVSSFDLQARLTTKK